MISRILPRILCALVLAPASLPAQAIARPENGLRYCLSDSLKSALWSAPQVVDQYRERSAGGYDSNGNQAWFQDARGNRTDYSYDVVGNLTNRQSSLTGVTNLTLSFDARDRITAHGYDNNGSTTNADGFAFAYDFENRLLSDGTVTNVYDGDGNRVSKTVGSTTTQLLVDDRNPSGYAQVLEELTVAGGSTNVSRQYTYGHRLISQNHKVAGNWTNTYFLHDARGSVRWVYRSDGGFANAYDYDAFGNLVGSVESNPNVYRYTDEQWDPDLKLYYLRARYMSPAFGRFWSIDSYEGNNQDPLSLHKYLYAHADPVNGIDPSGHDFTLTSVLTATSIRSALASMAIGAPFRAYHAARQFEAGVNLGTIGYDATIGVLTDGALGAALPGIAALGSRIVPVGTVLRIGGNIVGRATSSVWNLTDSLRGRMIENLVFGGREASLKAIKNFPVIDDFFQGVATSVKSIDLFAPTYQSASALKNRIVDYAFKLSLFKGAERGAVRVAENQIEKRVLIIAVEEGAASQAQMQALIEAVLRARIDAPFVQVVLKFVP